MSSLDKFQGSKEKHRYHYLVSALELIFRAMIYFLNYKQSLQSKQGKYEQQLADLEKKEKTNHMNMHVQNIHTIKQKISSIKKKIEGTHGFTQATGCIRFLTDLKQNSILLNMGSKYIADLNDLIGQIADISRLMILTDRAEAAVNVDDFLLQLESPGIQGNVTSVSSTLNIMQVQQAAFDKKKVQANLEFIIRQLAAVYAMRQKNYKNRDVPEFEEADLREIYAKIDQSDTKIDFDLFSTEFQVAVLGIGKIQNNAPRYGEPAAQNQFWSFPSNEKANREFISVFNQALKESCDLHIAKKQNETKLTKGSKSILLKQKVIDMLAAKQEPS